MKWESYSHPISDIRDWDQNQRLELRPDFQRNEVWSKAAQVMLIDTIIRGIPIPKIYIKSIITDGKTYRIVIDGQQRLTAILKFVKNNLKLKNPYVGEFQDKKFNELPDDVQKGILRYKIDINEIFNPTDEEIRDLYSRVNKYTVQLNKQELRRADFPGDFIDLAEEVAEMKFFELAKIFSVKQRRRMLDVEYIEELLTILLAGMQDKKDYLDDICESNTKMDNREEVSARFANIIADIQTIFDPEILPIGETRFKQKSDFYTLFACIDILRSNNLAISGNLFDVRTALREMDEKIGPQSEEEEYREYATRCLSDANSIANRKWRAEFLLKRISGCYGNEG